MLPPPYFLLRGVSIFASIPLLRLPLTHFDLNIAPPRGLIFAGGLVFPSLQSFLLSLCTFVVFSILPNRILNRLSCIYSWRLRKIYSNMSKLIVIIGITGNQAHVLNFSILRSLTRQAYPSTTSHPAKPR